MPSCHWFNRQDVQCDSRCPDDCLGDFTETLREHLEWMEVGDQENLGRCDAHETDVLVTIAEGQPWITHLIPWTPALGWKRPDEESPENEPPTDEKP